MEIPKGMEEMVFSFAYYQVKDFDRLLSFLKGLEKKGLFSIDELNIKSQKFGEMALAEKQDKLKK